MDNNSFNYQIPEKEDSGAISSDGEFNEMQEVEPLLDGADGTDPQTNFVVLAEYERLCKQRFGDDVLKLQALMSNFDHELMSTAFTSVQSRASQRKHLRTRLVKNGFSSFQSVFPRWASDSDALAKIVQTQRTTINPEAVFGKIDPRNQGLDYMFADLHRNGDSFDQRGSSGKTYKDAAEFATPLDGGSRKKIDTHNVSNLTNFNPFLAETA